MPAYHIEYRYPPGPWSRYDASGNGANTYSEREYQHAHDAIERNIRRAIGDAAEIRWVKNGT